ncbi:hypothetical protein [Nocardioides convexus]|uniref:hypothetical protein n=1 Tax=Nocardioides convexus TaxID=2712224 RepID=UPI0024188C86|nr:hypothetical protein [Nocardioides convexus]
MQILLPDGSVLPDVAYLTSAQARPALRGHLEAGSGPGRPHDLDPQAVRGRRRGHPRQEVRGCLRH